MKRVVFFFSVLVCSCNYFESKKVEVKDIVAKELETMDWNAVDQYPSFTVCDSVTEKQAKKHCFESTILNHVNSYLSSQQITVSTNVDDMAQMQLKIDAHGTVSVNHIAIKPETEAAIPDIKQMLVGSILALPKIYPATKRGQQVTTGFMLPVHIRLQ